MKASIVIPTFNAGPGFEQLLGRLAAQEAAFGYEILIVDSGSTDGTIELARRHGASVYRIPQEEFDHGEARNLGISHAEGEYVAFIVQDALPVDDRWLAAMVENLDKNGTVAGVYGRQIPRPESSPLTRALMDDWPTSGLERREQFAGGPGIYSEMSPEAQRTLATFDNVSSCVRRSVWETFPFERTDFGEDVRWGKSIVEAGYRLVYEPRSAVLHSHERGALYDLRRHYADQLVLDELFGARLVPSLPRLILGIPYATSHVYRLLKREEPAPERRPKLLLDAAIYALASQLGAYLGCKVSSLSHLSPKLHAKLHRFLGKGV